MSTRAVRRAKRKSASSSADKWKSKVWLNVKTPDYIGDKSLGQTPANELTSVIGRTVKASLMDLTGSFKDLNYQLTFKITQINGREALTEFSEFELSRDYRRSQIRNHRSKVEGIFNYKLSDDAKVRITTFVVTPVRAAASAKKEIRDNFNAKMAEICSELNFPAFVDNLINGKITEELVPVAEEVFPIKVLEISKVKVVKLPTDRIVEKTIIE